MNYPEEKYPLKDESYQKILKDKIATDSQIE
jgi:hypothetical protein